MYALKGSFGGYETDVSFALFLGFCFVFCSYYVSSVVKRPIFACKKNGKFANFLWKHCGEIQIMYWPTFWCFESRLQTIVAVFLRATATVKYRSETLILPDGGEVLLDWADNDESAIYPCKELRPTVVILPGLTGTSRENYVTQLVESTLKDGYRAVVFNYRGVGGGKLLTPRTYCAANTEDLECVVDHIREELPKAPLLGTGISLGAMMLFHYISNKANDCAFSAGMLMSPPWNVFESTKTLESPMNWLLFNRHLASSLAQHFKNQLHIFKDHFKEDDIHQILKSRSIREFDTHYTSRMFGYKSVDHYYEHASIHDKIHLIERPLLCLNAGDDPFSPLHALPLDDVTESDHVAIVATSHGGHIGFLDGIWPRRNTLMFRLFNQYVNAVFHHGEELVDRAPKKRVGISFY